MLKARIHNEKGMPQLYVNDQRTAPMLLWLNTYHRKFNDLNSDQATSFGNLGMHLYSAFTHLALRDDDFEDARAALRCIIAGDPEAKILLRVSMSPTGDEARQWAQEHPDDLMDWHVVHTEPYNNGMVNETSIVGNTPAAITVASDDWFSAAKKAVIDMYHALNNDPEFSDHLLGLHLGGGETSEWFHYGLRERGIDYSKTNAKKYAQWLTAKYGADCDVALPEDLPGNDRMVTPERTLLTWETDQRFIDYAEYSSWIMSERIIDFTHCVREAMGPDKLVVCFYGYLFELYDPRTGHFMLNRVLESPDIDALTSPVSYTDRCHGGIGALMSPADTITAHGKLWIVENDIRSPNVIRKSIGPDGDWVEKVDSVERYQEVLKREAGQMLIHGLGCWYMDLNGHGWFHHPMIWNQIGQLNDLYTRLQPKLRPIAPDVAVIVDEEGIFRQGHADYLGVNLLYRTRLSMYCAGISFGMYTARDFEDGLIPSAKAAFYLTPFAITPERAEKIRRIASRNKTNLIFMHGFGVTSAEVTKQLSGMEYGIAEGKLRNLEMAGREITWQDERWGEQLANPVTWVEKGGKVLATYTTGDLSGRVAAAINDMGDYTAVFVGATELSADAVRELCRLVGVHIYCESKDTFLCGNGVYMLHNSREEGLRKVVLPEVKRLVLWPQGTEVTTDTLLLDGQAVTQIWIEKQRLS